MNAIAWFENRRHINGRPLDEAPEAERRKTLPADIAVLTHDEVIERLNQIGAMTIEEKFGGKTKEQLRNFMFRYDALFFRLTEILEGRG